MKTTISIMSEEFENEQTGERIEGVTVMIDGMLSEFFKVIRHKNPNYSNNVDIVRDALMRGLESIKNEN
ncbi:MAG: hypothetical protein ACC608_00535 [Anaerofustis sp.]